MSQNEQNRQKKRPSLPTTPLIGAVSSGSYSIADWERRTRGWTFGTTPGTDATNSSGIHVTKFGTPVTPQE